MLLFDALVIGHVVAGITVLISFWVPIFVTKGGVLHKRWGRVFAAALLAAAVLAIAMAVLNLTSTNDRHAVLKDRGLFDGLFGWMMLYLGVLTIGLGHYGFDAARHRGNLSQVRFRLAVMVQLAVIAAAVKCAWEGWQLAQPLMMGLAALGGGAAFTFLTALFQQKQSRGGHVAEHLKAMVGAGISAYTAFLSVGLLRVAPALVFHPAIWSIPSVVGVMLIIHYRKTTKHLRSITPRSG